MKTLLVFGLLLAMTTFAQAQETRKLTYEQASALFGALQSLDGHQRVVKDGQQERIVQEPYDIAPGLRLVIAQDMLKAKAAVGTLQVAFAAVQKQFVGADGKVPDDKLVAFNVEVRKLQQEMSDEQFTPIRYEELKPSTNNFPPSVLAGLMPVLVIDEKK